MLTIGADSHTCTYGAVNGFSTASARPTRRGHGDGQGVVQGAEAIKVNLMGEKPADITGKDVILTIIGMIASTARLYKSLEFAGPGVKALTMTDRLTISNMAIEAGGKAGIFPFDEITKAYVDGRVTKPYEPVAADEDAEYCREVDINLRAQAGLLPSRTCRATRSASRTSRSPSRSIRSSSVPARMAA